MTLRLVSMTLGRFLYHWEGVYNIGSGFYGEKEEFLLRRLFYVYRRDIENWYNCLGPIQKKSSAFQNTTRHHSHSKKTFSLKTRGDS